MALSCSSKQVKQMKQQLDKLNGSGRMGTMQLGERR